MTPVLHRNCGDALATTAGLPQCPERPGTEEAKLLSKLCSLLRVCMAKNTPFLTEIKWACPGEEVSLSQEWLAAVSAQVRRWMVAVLLASDVVPASAVVDIEVAVHHCRDADLPYLFGER